MEVLRRADADRIVRLVDWHTNYQETRRDIPEGFDRLNLNRVGDVDSDPVSCTVSGIFTVSDRLLQKEQV